MTAFDVDCPRCKKLEKTSNAQAQQAQQTVNHVEQQQQQLPQPPPQQPEQYHQPQQYHQHQQPQQYQQPQQNVYQGQPTTIYLLAVLFPLLGFIWGVIWAASSTEPPYVRSWGSNAIVISIVSFIFSFIFLVNYGGW